MYVKNWHDGKQKRGKARPVQARQARKKFKLWKVRLTTAPQKTCQKKHFSLG